MAFERHTWRDRISEYPTRRRLVDAATGAESLVDIGRAEGAVHTEGDVLNAAALNGLEGRVAGGFAEAAGTLAAHAGQLDEQGRAIAEGARAFGAHAADAGNPHGVSCEQIGAAGAGALAAHAADEGNPHGVRCAQIGAAEAEDLAAHLADGPNPHGLTREDIGAASEAGYALHKAAMEALTAEHSGRLTEHDAALGAQAERLDGQEADLAVQEGRLDGHDTSLTAQAGRLDGHDADLAAQKKRLDEQEEALDAQGGQLVALDEALAGHTATLDGHTQDIAALAGRATGFDSAIAALQSQSTSQAGALAALDGRLTSEAARLEGLIGEAGGGAEVRVNIAPGSAKWYPGAPVGHITAGVGGGAMTFVPEASPVGGWPGCLAMYGNSVFTAGFVLATGQLLAGETLHFELAAATALGGAATATLFLSEKSGLPLSGDVEITIGGTPGLVRGTISPSRDFASEDLWFCYTCVEPGARNVPQRLYSLRLFREGVAYAPGSPPLETEVFDPQGVGGDAFDAGNHRLVGYQSAGIVQGGDTVLDAIAKLEARVKALGG